MINRGQDLHHQAVRYNMEYVTECEVSDALFSFEFQSVVLEKIAFWSKRGLFGLKNPIFFLNYQRKKKKEFLSYTRYMYSTVQRTERTTGGKKKKGPD